MSDPARPLTGRLVVTTRDEPGRLDALLSDMGAQVVHVPLIEVVDVPGDELASALAAVERYAWVVVTSRHGARRVGAAVASASGVRTAAVGSATAAVLRDATGRPVTVVPARHTAADLVDAMPDAAPGERALVAQADRAAPTLVDGLTARGYAVDAVVAYATRVRRPGPPELDVLRSADAVAFASGSAAVAWSEAVGAATPPIAVAIGPTTAAVARERGLQITSIAADHTVEGLAAEVAAAFTTRP